MICYPGYFARTFSPKSCRFALANRNPNFSSQRIKHSVQPISKLDFYFRVAALGSFGNTSEKADYYL